MRKANVSPHPLLIFEVFSALRTVVWPNLWNCLNSSIIILSCYFVNQYFGGMMIIENLVQLLSKVVHYMILQCKVIRAHLRAPWTPGNIMNENIMSYFFTSPNFYHWLSQSCPFLNQLKKFHSSDKHQGLCEDEDKTQRRWRRWQGTTWVHLLEQRVDDRIKGKEDGGAYGDDEDKR